MQLLLFGGKFHVSTGIGLNLFNAEPTTCIQEILRTAKSPIAETIRPETLLVGILNELEPMLDHFEASGFTDFHDDYLNHWLHSNEVVTVKDREGRASEATILGVTKTGCLLARGSDGMRVELMP